MNLDYQKYDRTESDEFDGVDGRRCIAFYFTPYEPEYAGLTDEQISEKLRDLERTVNSLGQGELFAELLQAQPLDDDDGVSLLDYGDNFDGHEHVFSTAVQHGWMTGEPSRECRVFGCNHVSLDLDGLDEDD